MDRASIFQWVKKTYGTEPDYPWNDRNAVLRHKDNRKWYGVVLEASRKTLGLAAGGDPSGYAEVLNVKSDPDLIGSLRGKKGFLPAYHMNKENWISILLDGSVPEEEIKSLLGLSYQLTATKETSLSKNTVIREMERKDYESIAVIWRDALGYSTITEEIVAETCEKMKGDTRYHTLVADVKDKVVGFVTTVEALAINQPNGYMKVNGLAVLPEFQHRGIGKMLMERVEELAGERGISLIGLASGFQRTNAHEFYEHLGYQKLSFWFRKNLQGQDK